MAIVTRAFVVLFHLLRLNRTYPISWVPKFKRVLLVSLLCASVCSGVYIRVPGRDIIKRGINGSSLLSELVTNQKFSISSLLPVGPDAGKPGPQARVQGAEEAAERSFQANDQPEAERATHPDHSTGVEAPAEDDLCVLTAGPVAISCPAELRMQQELYTIPILTRISLNQLFRA